jgi:lipoic acid synthetase
MNTLNTSPKKPKWIKVKGSCSSKLSELKQLLRKHQLHTVCESAACPNIAECFGHGTATFLIMGNTCTRNCSFCNIKHGKPKPLDPDEPTNLANAIQQMQLRYVVITSVTRDDLADGGAAHYVACMHAISKLCQEIKIEILVPDFHNCQDLALSTFKLIQPYVFNHNIETVPRLYREIRPGAKYTTSLALLNRFKALYPNVITKSGLMLGLGETTEEIKEVLLDLRKNNCDMLTLEQYLQPSSDNIAVTRYMTPEEFTILGEYAKSIGFKNVASAPLVRPSYLAELQVKDCVGNAHEIT